MPLTVSERRYLIAASLCFFAVIVGGLVASVWGHAIAQAFVDGGYAERLGRSVRATDGLDEVTAWQHRLKAVTIRLVLAALGMGVLLVCLGLRKRDWIVTRYFREQDYPAQLAAVRVIVFATALFVLYQARPLEYVGLPGSMTEGAFPLKRVLRGVSFPVGFSTGVFAVFLLSCITGMLGFFSRTSAWVATLSGVYILGVPQSFGKVNHFHTAVWLPAMLAMSRCGDFYAIDAIWRARRLGAAGLAIDAGPSREYALPVRLLWLMLGVIYTFPGFYKFFGGTHDQVLEWAFSDSLRYSLTQQWHMKDIDPIFRLDEYPRFCQFSALMVILWEFFWPVALFFPRLRVPLAISTIIFHTTTSMLMGISFMHLRLTMLVLFPWHSIGQWFGRRLFSDSLQVCYDAAHRGQLAAVNLIQSFNVFDRLSVAPREQVADATVKAWPDSGLQVVRHSLTAEPAAARSAVYRRLGWFAPRALGDAIFGHVARPLEAPAAANLERGASLRGVVILAAMLGVVEFGMAVMHIHRAWPFAVFPTFEVVTRSPEADDMRIEMIDAAGKETVLDPKPIRRTLRASIWYEMIMRAMEDAPEEERQERLRALWDMLAQKDLVEPERWSAVRFYGIKVDTIPEHKGQPPLEEHLLWEMPVNVSAEQPAKAALSVPVSRESTPRAPGSHHRVAAHRHRPRW